MNKLRSVIKQYGRWANLSMYIDRIEAHIDLDFSISLENAKSLLEAVGKEICEQNNHTLNPGSSINGIMKQSFKSLGFVNSDMVKQISQSLATIGQKLGELRNEIGATAHGRTLGEISDRNGNIDQMTREFLIDTVESVSVFLIHTFESLKEEAQRGSSEEQIDYFEAEVFNEAWDESYGDFSMGDYSYTASEILFHVDNEAYNTEYKTFQESIDITNAN